MGYRIVHGDIKTTFFTNGEDRIEAAIQPFLDQGAEKGWTLHSWKVTEGTKGIDLVLIWETPG